MALCALRGSTDAVAGNRNSVVCPLCGAQVTATANDLDALGKHFERCPKTELPGLPDPKAPVKPPKTVRRRRSED